MLKILQEVILVCFISYLIIAFVFSIRAILDFFYLIRWLKNTPASLLEDYLRSAKDKDRALLKLLKSGSFGIWWGYFIYTIIDQGFLWPKKLVKRWRY